MERRKQPGTEEKMGGGGFKAGGWHVEKICSLVQCREPLMCFVHSSRPLSTKLYLSAAHRGHFPPTNAHKRAMQTGALVLYS